MTGPTYLFEPAPGYAEYKVTSMLKDYLGMLLKQSENQETIRQILKLIDGYIDQLKKLRAQNGVESTKEVYKAIDGFFNAAPEENKKDIQCKVGCTACCFIDVEVSVIEAQVIINYCIENAMEVDQEYLIKQSAVGRKTYSDLSRCYFLKNNICSIYPVRPIACRKHWVKTEPALCDFSENIVNRIGGYFDVNTEILASAFLNVETTSSLEKALLCELEKLGSQGVNFRRQS